MGPYSIYTVPLLLGYLSIDSLGLHYWYVIVDTLKGTSDICVHLLLLTQVETAIPCFKGQYIKNWQTASHCSR